MAYKKPNQKRFDNHALGATTLRWFSKQIVIMEKGMFKSFITPVIMIQINLIFSTLNVKSHRTS